METATFTSAQTETGNTTKTPLGSLSKIRNRILLDHVWVAVPDNRIFYLLRNRRFKNCFETPPPHHKHCAKKYRTLRLEYETEIFGIPTTTPLHQRPIYGYLADTVNTAAENLYGNFHFKLNPTVKNYSTVTFGDSLIDQLTPVHIADIPKISNRHLTRTILNTSHNLDDAADIDKILSTRQPYTEIQILGGVPINTIQSVTVTKTRTTKTQWRRTETILRQLENANIHTIVIP